MSPQNEPVSSVKTAPRNDESDLQPDDSARRVAVKPANRLMAIGDPQAQTESIPDLAQPRRRVAPPWLRRRWWVLLLCLVAGTGGGYLARSSQTPMYSASAQLNVSSGGGPNGPGPANDANAAALTDASIIPADQSTMARVSQLTGVPQRQVTMSVSAAVVAGTSIIEVSYKAKTANEAVAGVNAVARVLNNGSPDSAIPKQSLVVVELATSAPKVGSIHAVGIPLGIILGLFVGALAVLAIERADPRVDGVEDLARITGTAASAFPGPVSVVELERNIAVASTGAADVTIVPLSESEELQAAALWKYLTMGVHQPTMALTLVGAGSSRNATLAEASGPTVIVVRPNARSRVIQASVLRLQMLGRGPVWAVLAVGKLLPEKLT
jgi:capsular polysaccharide biosynthesis protein